jgi:DNA-directed RNA polymerase subunit RPC12/RpoP
MEKSNNNETFVIVAKFTTSVEANLAKSKLDAADIQCFVDNENYLYSRPLGYVNLQVWEKDKEQALMILGFDAIPDEETTETDDIIVVCPYCQSENVCYGINRNKANTLFIAGTFFLQSLPFYKKKIYYCNTCGKHFKVLESPKL